MKDKLRPAHSALKARARLAEHPSMKEWLERTGQLKAIPAKRSAAQVIRKLRDAR
jgi:hypothetical protein